MRPPPLPSSCPGWAPRRTRGGLGRLLAIAAAAMAVVALAGCSPRPAPLAARPGDGGEVVAVTPRCEVGTFAVLVHPAGEGPGAAPIAQIPVPTDGGALPTGVRLADGERIELSLAQTSFELGSTDLEVLDGDLLVAEGGADAARRATPEEWGRLSAEHCAAGRLDVLLVLGLVLAGVGIVAATVTGWVIAWRARRRPGVLLTTGLLVTGCAGWIGFAVLHLSAGRRRRGATPRTVVSGSRW